MTPAPALPRTFLPQVREGRAEGTPSPRRGPRGPSTGTRMEQEEAAILIFLVVKHAGRAYGRRN